METVKVRGGDRAKKAFELEDFGFEIPVTSPPASTPQLPEEVNPS